MDERGQVLPLVAVVVVLAGAVCLGTGRLGGAAVARARAVTAADAAALAGAAAGPDAARQAASANGGHLVSFRRIGADARVVVTIGAARATARARRDANGTAGRGDLAPALRAALARAGDLLGAVVPVVPAVPGVPGAPGVPGVPGVTEPTGDAAARHRAGLAVHVPTWFVSKLVAVAPGAGLCQPAPDDHPVHFELCPFRLP